MDFRKLQAFASVYELQSFSKAAQELYLSQPTVSTHVSSLETELGIKLFDRIGRKVLPTQAGQILYSGVSKIFKTLEQTKSDVQDLVNEVQGVVVIGGSTIPSTYLLPDVIASYRRQYSKVQVDLRIGDSISICRKVLDGDLDFGIVGGFVDHFDLEHELLTKDKLYLVKSTSFEIDYSRLTDMQYFAGLPWVLREKGSGTRQAFEHALLDMNTSVKDINVTTLVHSTEALVRCILAGAGLGVTSKLAVQSYIEAGLMEKIELSSLEIKRNFYIIKHRRRTLFTCSTSLLSCLKNHLASQA
ncbi:selenium metabolism-associated LysR family transcriptional regulator [Desulfonatronovibrio magnus]|uniref:selenium metabolism-associated LysR family transcriptional regulator n=1 Tax=Desulfonatronovibrio magnus TaxID=698827 RepID=UPI0005EB2D83|nr:selenium metabolism-associated LysR family transcriptional regulator [Desulfonatronovibrio magnus]